MIYELLLCVYTIIALDTFFDGVQVFFENKDKAKHKLTPVIYFVVVAIISLTWPVSLLLMCFSEVND